MIKKESELAPGTTPEFAGIHKWLERGLLVCLTALVLEGAFTFPLLAMWYGWPQLTLQEICTELERVRFSDDTRTCIYPYPLFAPAEGAGQKTARDAWGVQPRPLYKAVEYREFVRKKEARLRQR
ncbi:MAG: hypothetical protein ABW352_19820 [Polyangiales bacterium]